MTMTKQNANAWAHLSPKWREKRMYEWAEILENRLKQLDPNYKFFPWGGQETVDVIDCNGQKICDAYIQEM